MSKIWVFKELVKDDKDLEGLLAYALYKSKKNRLATTLRQEGRPESYIQAEVDRFHDQCVASGHIDHYKDQAERLLAKLYSDYEQSLLDAHRKQCLDVEAKHKKEIAKIQDQHKKDLKKGREKLVRQALAFKASEESRLKKFALWVVSGLPGAIASIFVALASLLILLATVEPAKRAQFITEAVAKALTGQ